MVMEIKIILLAFIACMSAIIDTIAGGGGLITVPALLLSGLNPITALSTNKLQACFGSGTAASYFIRKSYLSLHEVVWGVVWSFLGAVIGTLLLHVVDVLWLKPVIPGLLLCVWGYLFFLPKLQHKTRLSSWNPRVFFPVFGFILGFYDGILGPGTGSFWVFFIILFLGWDLKRATIHTKLYNFTSNLASFLVFLVGGYINYKIGFAMALGQMLGGYIGSKLVIHKGVKLIRPMLLSVTGLMLLVLAYQEWMRV